VTVELGLSMHSHPRDAADAAAPSIRDDEAADEHVAPARGGDAGRRASAHAVAFNAMAS
jgi:hypothetical protein